MIYRNFKGAEISRLGIGTVQFGFDYGINNKLGQVSYQDVLSILEKAREEGVNFLDTSRAYGTSEEVLGKALKEIEGRDDFFVCTKLDLPRNWNELPENEVLQNARDSFSESMETLRLGKIPFYLLHKLDYYTYAGGVIWEFLKEQQDKGFLGRIGISIGGGPDEALTALSDGRMEIIQIPYNIYDWRWTKAGVFEQAASRDVMIVNRSTFLQGLLVMTQDDAAEKLPRSLPYRKRLEETADEWGCSLKELVLQYVFSNPGITSTILGVDSPEQFGENISIFNNSSVPEDVLEKAYNRFTDVPEDVLNPALWNQPYKGNQYKSKKV